MRTILLLPFLISAIQAAYNATSISPHLRATAIITTPQNTSAFECWHFTSPILISSQAGTSGASTFAFNHTTEAIYTVIPPRFNGGTHNAPAPQIVAFLSGLAVITLPAPAYGNSNSNSSLDSAWILGGNDGLLIAVDMTGSGHITTYPSDQATVSLQIHFEDVDAIPAYEAVAKGPCRFDSGDGQLVEAMK